MTRGAKHFPSILNLKIVQQGFVVVLCGQAGVHEVAVKMAPFPEPSVVEEFEIFGDDERHDSVCETLFEHHQPSHTTVPVLEGMNGLELLVKVDNVLQCLP